MGVARVALIAAAMAGTGLTGGAGRAQSAGGDDPLAACANIASRSARLACYDNAARRHVPTPPSRDQASARPQPMRPSRGGPGPIAQGLGAEQVRDRRPKADRPAEVTRTTAKVISATDNGIGHWRFVMEGGSVWEMTLADPHFLPPRPGQEVRIRRGAVGGYLIDFGRQSAVRVARIR